MQIVQSWFKALSLAVLCGIIAAACCSPLALIVSAVTLQVEKTMTSNLTDMTEGNAPGVTTILDNSDKPIAYLYKQRRYPTNDIAPVMKQAIVAIEDRRFYEHEGVDWQGNLRAMVANLLHGGVRQGASTLDQQYVKNYLLLVAADNEEEESAAIETSITRKLREMRMAADLDKRLTKDEILTRYLNLVPFGSGAYGVEAAAQIYFNSHANQLTLAQAALLAGVVQSSSGLSPYVNPEGALERRNVVLDAMVQAGNIDQATADRTKLEPLGTLPEPPAPLPNGCINAGNRGFFCDFVLDYLDKKGLDKDTITHGAYVIRTTLDPTMQDAATKAVQAQVSSKTSGAAEVLNLIEPSMTSRKILAMASSRDYGLDLEQGQSVQPQPWSLVGDGAGSIFKIFTAAVAIEKLDYNAQTVIQIPRRLQLQGFGFGGAAGCPAGYYCVENDGVFASQMTLQQALATSPNTGFVNLISKTGVDDVVDTAVKMGLRSYTNPGSYDGTYSVADYVKEHNLGSFTLGPTAVNDLELSNVAATIAANGVWCEPNPIVNMESAIQPGSFVSLPVTQCESAISPTTAAILAQAMSSDTVNGTAAVPARTFGWSSPLAAKTGTTETHKSAAFMGLNTKIAGVSYVYNDGTTVSPLCSGPLRQCSSGDVYGADEPAKGWFSAVTNGYNTARQGVLPQIKPVSSLIGATKDEALTALGGGQGYTIVMVPGGKADTVQKIVDKRIYVYSGTGTNTSSATTTSTASTTTTSPTTTTRSRQ